MSKVMLTLFFITLSSLTFSKSDALNQNCYEITCSCECNASDGCIWRDHRCVAINDDMSNKALHWGCHKYFCADSCESDYRCYWDDYERSCFYK